MASLGFIKDIYDGEDIKYIEIISKTIKEKAHFSIVYTNKFG